MRLKDDAGQFAYIYEGQETHRINLQTFTHDLNLPLPAFGEAQQADGEAARLYFNTDGMAFENVYQQGPLFDTLCAPLASKIFASVFLGQAFFNAPNRINDFYDDLRLAAT